MSNISKIMAKELNKSGSQVKFIYGNVFGNIPPIIEWIKWLSYEPEFEKNRIEHLNSKGSNNLSYEELNELDHYMKRKRMAQLFKKYDCKECSKKEYMEVYSYMSNESIITLMLDKLTVQEIKYAEEEIKKLITGSSEELPKKIKVESQKENYLSLPMVDAYILHIIDIINYTQSMNEFNSILNWQLDSNAIMRQKSKLRRR